MKSHLHMMQKKSVLFFFINFFSLLPAALPQQKNDVEKMAAAFSNAMLLGKRELLPGMEKSVMAQLKQKKNLTPKQVAILYTLAGSIKRENYKIKEAMQFLTQALPLCEQEFGKTSAEAIEAKRYLSWTYGDVSNHAMERKYVTELLDHYKPQEKKYAIEIADMYNTIGMDYGYDGDRTTEQYYLNLGRNLMEEYQPGNRVKEHDRQYNLVNIYNSLSVSYNASNNFYNALMYARQSLALRQLIMPGSPERAINLMIIGKSLFQTEGNLDSALFYLNESIAVFEKKGPSGESMKGDPPWISYKSYKANMLTERGRMDEAIVEAISAIRYLQDTKTPDPLTAGSLIQAYVSLSRAYMAKGEYTKALAAGKEAIIRFQGMTTIGNMQKLALKAQYATALSSNKAWAAAGEAFASAIAATNSSVAQLANPFYTIPVTVPYDYLLVYKQAADYITAKGFAGNNRQEITAGINMLKNIARSMEKRNAWYFEAGIDEGIGARDPKVYDDLLNALYMAKGIIAEQDRMADAFAFIEAPKAGLLKNKLSEDKRMLMTLPKPVNEKRLALKVGVYEAMKKVMQSGDGTSQAGLLKKKEVYMAFLHEVKQKYLPHEAREINSISVNDPILTGHKGTVVNYFLSASYLFAFIHENGSRKFIRKNIPPGFEDDLALLKQKCLTKNLWSDPETVKKAADISRQWYRWLLGDVVNTSGELLIIPHRQLSLISFEMLDAATNREAPQYVLEKRPVSYTLSASLMRPSGNEQAGKNLLGFGGFASSNFVLTANGSGQEMIPDPVRDNIEQTLEGTTREVSEISRMMNGDAFTHVSPGDFLRHAGNYRVLHIATHALADQGPYHECNLLFETDSAGKNIVRDVEIASLHLKADMAVLSACNTGMGKMHSSEGMLSLGRSFFIAGCPSVVMSLWTVNDASTAKIMTGFYQYLKEGESKSAALRHAKLDYLRTENNPAKKHPFYWAGFIVVGDNAPLKNISGRHYAEWVVAGVLLIGIIATAVYFRRRSRSSRA